MDKCIVVVINNNQARFFSLEPAEWPEYESGPNLIEQKSLSYSTSNYYQKFWFKLINKQERLRQKNHLNHYKLENQFARQITSEIINLIRLHQGQKLILIAQPQVLNLVKKFFTPTIFKALQIKELHKDISHFNCGQIHQYLAQKQFLPACQKVFYPK